MHRISIAIVVALLSTECYAQGGPTGGQCDQVRSAISQYGLQAARKHAMANYNLTLADVLRIEQECGIGKGGRRTNR